MITWMLNKTEVIRYNLTYVTNLQGTGNHLQPHLALPMHNANKQVPHSHDLLWVQRPKKNNFIIKMKYTTRYENDSVV